MTCVIDVSEWQHWEVINDYSDFITLPEIIELCSIKVASKRVNIRSQERKLIINENFENDSKSEIQPSENKLRRSISNDHVKDFNSTDVDKDIVAARIQKYIRASVHRYKSIFVEKKSMMLRRKIVSIENNYINCMIFFLKEKLQFLLTFKNLSIQRNALKRVVIYLHPFKEELQSIQRARYLADFVWDNLIINVVFDNIYIQSMDSRIRIDNVHKDNSAVSMKREVLIKFINAIIMIQRIYRRGKRRELQGLLVEAKQVKGFKSTLISKRVKKIGDTYFRIMAYSNLDGGYNFVLINLDEAKIFRITFYSESQKVINTRGLQLIDYLMEMVTIKNGSVDFLIENEYSDLDSNYKYRPQIKEKIDDNFKQEDNVNQDMYRVLQISQPVDDSNRIIYSVVIGDGKVNQNPNTVEVKMSLLDLQRRIPNLSLKDPKTVRSFAEEITSSFKVKNNGNLEVDTNKIDPKCVKLDKVSSFGQLEKNMKKVKNETKNVLCKTTRISDDKKYLIIAYLLERCLATRDDVFEDYEIVIQFVANSLSSNKVKELIWEIPKYEILELTGIENEFKAAKLILEKLFVFEEREKEKLGCLKYVYASKNKSEVQRLTSDTVMAIDCKTLPMIQKRFRNRVFIKNYKLYKQDLKGTGKKVIKKDIISVLNVQYLFVLYERSASNIGVFAWDLDMFKRLMRDFDIFTYETNYLRDKERFATKMIKHLSVKQDGKGIVFEEMKFSNELIKNDMESPTKSK